MLAAALLAHTTASCAVDSSWSEPPAVEHSPSTPEAPPEPQSGEEAEPLEPEESLSAPWSSAPALSCEDIRPAELGPGRSIILRGHGPAEADCGPGTSNGAGFLALMNSGPFGATAWDVVSGAGVPTGHVIAGGDVINILLPQPHGFQNYRVPPGGALLNAYAADGTALRSVRLNESGQIPFDVAADPRGGSLFAQWLPRADGTQVLTFQFFNEQGLPRTEPIEVTSAPQSEARFVFAGVDTKGRGLLLWPGPTSDTWVGQWFKRDGEALTATFSFPKPPLQFSLGLAPLVGGGLVLQTDGQWVLQFPGGKAGTRPPPDWLVSHPGARLVLIRGQRAYALVPPPTLVEGSGCQESLLLFSSDGTACGELTLPFGGAFCDRRVLGLGPDGTVVQQIDLSIPANNQCAWRWWPRLLR
ncbi:MAG: hypothetical protein ACXU86_14200 [Archangium sp.]